MSLVQHADTANFEPALGKDLPHVGSGALNTSDLFLQNLLLLGFDVAHAKKKFNCELSPGMFKQANQKGMEVIMHFLLSKIDPGDTASSFRGCWPILDKTQANEFKALTFARLQAFEQDGHIPKGVFRKSTINQPGGERFYLLVWHVSNLAVERVLAREYSFMSIPTVGVYADVPSARTARGGRAAALAAADSALDTTVPENALLNVHERTSKQLLAQHISATKCHIVRQSRMFVKHAQRVVASQEEWKETASKLEADHKAAGEELEAVRAEHKAFMSSQRARPGAPESQPLSMEQLHEKAQRVGAAYASIEELRHSSTHGQTVVEELVKDGADRVQINGHELRSILEQDQRPDVDQQDGKVVSDETHTDKLDLVELAHRWLEGLEDMRSTIHLLTSSDKRRATGGDPQKQSILDDVIVSRLPSLEETLSSHQHALSNIRALSSAVKENLPQMQRDIRELKEQNGALVRDKGHVHRKAITKSAVKAARPESRTRGKVGSQSVSKGPRPGGLTGPVRGTLARAHTADTAEAYDAVPTVSTPNGSKLALVPPTPNDKRQGGTAGVLLEKFSRGVSMIASNPNATTGMTPMKQHSRVPSEPVSPPKTAMRAAAHKQIRGVVGMTPSSGLRRAHVTRGRTPASKDTSGSRFEALQDISQLNSDTSIDSMQHTRKKLAFGDGGDDTESREETPTDISDSPLTSASPRVGHSRSLSSSGRKTWARNTPETTVSNIRKTTPSPDAAAPSTDVSSSVRNSLGSEHESPLVWEPAANDDDEEDEDETVQFDLARLRSQHTIQEEQEEVPTPRRLAFDGHDDGDDDDDDDESDPVSNSTMASKLPPAQQLTPGKRRSWTQPAEAPIMDSPGWL